MAAGTTSSSELITSEICQFYKNKSIFITGATGFLGKALVEKLLRSCYSLDKIYLLVRSKKGKPPMERLNEITNCKLFDIVSHMHPDYKTKLVGIQGDLTEPNLGISDEDRQTLCKHVNIVFHSAATVRFDEPLKVAVNMNIIGVRKVIDLCKSIENLESFVHISTAYANCDRMHISEEVYNPPVKPDKLIEACNWLQDDLANYLTPRVIQLKPNTYTYTKAIAETLILQECKDKIPCAIVRPSIVGASWREPFPGWIDNFNGPTALFPATGTGVLSSMLGNHDAIADIIPVDIPVNLMIAVAWHTAVKSKKNKIVVYNCTSGQIKKLTWGMLETYGRDSFYKNPFEKLFFVPNPHFTTNIFVKYFRTLFEQLIPAYVLDFFLKLTHKKPLFVRLQKKIKKAVEILEYFTTKQWEFTNDNLFMLMKELNDIDNKVFNFDISDINWKSYIEQYCLGTKVYLMKEDMTNINACRRRLERMKFKRNLMLFGVVMLFFKFILMRTAMFKSFNKFVYQLALTFKDYALKTIGAASSSVVAAPNVLPVVS